MTLFIKDNNKNYHRFFQEQIWSNFVKRQGKTVRLENKVGDAVVNLQVDHTELQALEKALCFMTIKFPEILQDEEKKNFIFNLNFTDTELSDFRDWLLTNLSQNEGEDLKNIEEIVENTRFYDTFLLLIKLEDLLLNKSFDNNIDPKLLWELLHKKYYLVSLKLEYISVMQSGHGDSFKKAALYRDEIMKISKELQKLNESFFKY